MRYNCTKQAAETCAAAFDLSIPRENRAAFLSETLGDLHCFQAGGLEVRLEFTENGPPLQELLEALLLRRANRIN